MTTRYFTEEPVSGDRAKLAGAEAHHLIHVMRAAPGTQVVLFDGGGCEFDATVKEIGRTAVELDVLRRCEIDRELPLEITLAVPLPKGDRQRWLVEKATELGVRRLVPLTTERSVAQPAPRALERLRRTVIEASKQCGRNRLMEIAEPADWARFVTTTGETAHRWLAHPGGKGSSGDSGEGAMGGLPALAEPREDKGGQAAHGTQTANPTFATVGQKSRTFRVVAE